MAKLTKRTVDSAQPGKGNRFLWDEDISGFGLKVTPVGGKSFCYQYRAHVPGRQGTASRRIKIGNYGKLTPDEARHEAKRLAAMVALGGDPLAQRDVQRANQEKALTTARNAAQRQSDIAFNRLAGQFLDWYENEPKKGGGYRSHRSLEQARQIVLNHLVPTFRERPIDQLTPVDALKAVEAVPRQQTATRKSVHSYGRIVWRWAMRPPHHFARVNIFAVIDVPTPQPRDRVLTDGEVKAVWNATDSMPAYRRAYFRLLLITGQRRAEISGLKWEELDKAQALWTLPRERAKNGCTHLVPLSDLALSEIDALAGSNKWPATGRVLTSDGRAMTGFSKARRELDERIGSEGDWRVHDFRRTLATGMQPLGVRFEVVEAVLNHVSGSRSGVAGIYQRHDWAKEKRSALDAWARRLREIVSGQVAGDNVFTIGKMAS